MKTDPVKRAVVLTQAKNAIRTAATELKHLGFPEDASRLRRAVAVIDEEPPYDEGPRDQTETIARGISTDRELRVWPLSTGGWRWGVWDGVNVVSVREPLISGDSHDRQQAIDAGLLAFEGATS